MTTYSKRDADDLIEADEGSPRGTMYVDSKPLESRAEIVLIILMTVTCTVSAVLYAYIICWIGNESKCELHTSSPPCSRTENNVRLSQCNFTLEVPKIGKILLQLVSQPSKG